MSADKFHVRHEVGRSYVQRVAAFRPFIGSVFGLLVYFALQGGVIRQLDVPTTNATASRSSSSSPSQPGSASGW